MKKICEKHAVDPTITKFLQKFLFTFLLCILILLCLGQIGVNWASIVTILGTIGLTIALGLKDYLANLASGFILLFLRPFRIGDEIESMGYRGTVEEIGLFLTRITQGSKSIFLPNNQLINHVFMKEKTKGVK